MQSSLTSRVLVVCSQTPDDRELEAGDIQAPAIATRCWQMAEGLAADHDVILALPTVSELFHQNFAVVYYNGRNIRMVAQDSDVVVCDSAVLSLHPHLLDAGKPTVVDLAGVKPPAFDNPGTGMGPATSATADPNVDMRNADMRSAALDSSDVLADADFFICDAEEDRRLWLPALERAGRINPQTLEGDSGLRQLFEVVRPPDRLQPLIDYCAVPRYARDRGSRLGRAGRPGQKQHGGRSRHRGRGNSKESRIAAVWYRAKASIKRKFSG